MHAVGQHYIDYINFRIIGNGVVIFIIVNIFFRNIVLFTVDFFLFGCTCHKTRKVTMISLLQGRGQLLCCIIAHTDKGNTQFIFV